MEGNPLLDGVTFSGGDPLFNPEEFLKFLKKVKERTGLNVWCYTGYCYEDLLDDPLREPILHYIDVLVDGRFVKEQLEPRLYFRGSKNQRIIYLKDGRLEHIAKPEEDIF